LITANRPMPKLLHITRNYPPLWGGMERLNWHISAELSAHMDVRVIAPTGASANAPERVQVQEVPLKPLWKFAFATLWHSVRQARDWKPDIVLAGSGLTSPMAWIAARVCGAQAVVYTHGLDITAQHPVYRLLWLPFLRRMDLVIANSRATASLASSKSIDKDKILIVPPGTEIPTLDEQARQRFRNTYELTDRKVLLSVGRLTARKGLREFVSDVLPEIVRERPDTMLVIVGDAPTDSLYAQGQTPESILASAQAAGVKDNVLLTGKLFGQDLADAYAGADVHVFPVREILNDPEGFGMVAVEAAAHGLATVAYATGGIVDAVKEDESGKLVKPGDSLGFKRAVLEYLAAPPPRQMLTTYASQFSWKNFSARLTSALRNPTKPV